MSDMNSLFWRQATHESHTFDYGDCLPAFVQHYGLPIISALQPNKELPEEESEQMPRFDLPKFGTVSVTIIITGRCGLCVLGKELL